MRYRRAERFFDIIAEWSIAALKLGAVTAAALLLGWLSVSLGDCDAEREAWGSGEVSEAEVLRAVRTLQPSHSPAVAASWAGVFFEAGAETGIDPLLLVAIAFRESSIRTDVVGSRGELGPMQLHGVALSYMPRRCEATDMACNVRGGAAVLLNWQAECGGPWARWVGAYGLGRCPGDDEAEELRSVRRARDLYEQIGGERWE